MCPQERRKDKSAAEPTERKSRQYGPMGVLGAGMEMGVIIGLMAWGGWWLDEKYNTSPWLTLTGVVLGTVGGTYGVLKASKRYFDQR